MKVKITIAIAAMLLAIYHVWIAPSTHTSNAEELIGFNEDDARMATKDFYSVSPLSNTVTKNIRSSTKDHQDLKTIFSQKLHTETIDSTVQKIVLDNTRTRAEKINILWLMLENQLAAGADDLVSFEAVARGLATLWPIELTDKLIAAAGDQSLPPKARLYLIEALVRATKMYTLADSAVDGPKDFSYIALNMENIRSFFRQLISGPEIEEIMPDILYLAPSVLLPDEYPLIELASKSASTMTSETMLSLRLDMAMANAENQLQLLPDLLRDMNTGDYSTEDKELFLSRLAHFTEVALADEAEMGEAIPKDLVIPASVKLELLNFLRENEPTFTSEQFSRDILSSEEFINWFKPVSRLGVNDEDRARFITQYAEEASSPKHLVVMEEFLGDSEIRPYLLQSSVMRERLLKERSDPRFNSSEKELLENLLEYYELPY